MRFLCISDIHGHAGALRKVLAEGKDRGYDQLIVCGDHLFPGPAPLETWKILLREIAASAVVGLLVVDMTYARIRQINTRSLMMALNASNCAVLLLLRPHMQSNTAALRLHIEHQKWLRDGRNIVGCLSKVTVQKSRFQQAGNSVTLLIPFDRKAWS